MEGHMQVLTFSLNSIDFGIPLDDVNSIEVCTRVINIPGAPPNIRGIMRLHGSIVPVYSLAAKFAYGDQKIENIVAVGMGGMKIGLEVGKVKQILEVESRDIIPMPQIMNATQNWFHDVASCKKELIVLISVEDLFTLEERQSIRKMIEDSSKNEGE